MQQRLHELAPLNDVPGMEVSKFYMAEAIISGDLEGVTKIKLHDFSVQDIVDQLQGRKLSLRKLRAATTCCQYLVNLGLISPAQAAQIEVMLISCRATITLDDYPQRVLDFIRDGSISRVKIKSDEQRELTRLLRPTNILENLIELRLNTYSRDLVFAGAVGDNYSFKQDCLYLLWRYENLTEIEKAAMASAEVTFKLQSSELQKLRRELSERDAKIAALEAKIAAAQPKQPQSSSDPRLLRGNA